MALSIKCPHCGRVLKAGEQDAGKRVNCPACKKAFLAPKTLSKPKGPPPVATSDRVWHLHVDGRNDGPYTADALIEQVKTGKIGTQTLAWKEGMDDWQPLGQIAGFHGAFTTPPPVAKSPAKPKSEKDHERRARYVPGKGKRDVMVGVWIAVGLAVVLLVAILIVANRPQEPAAPPTRIVVRPPAAPTSATRNGKRLIRGPRPAAPPTKTVVRKVKKEKLLTDMVADLDAAFKAAIAAHRKGDKKPIFRLSGKCKSYAEKIASYEWGGYKSRIDTLVLRLNQAGDGIQTEMKDSSKDAWDIPEIGLDPEQKAKQLGLNEVGWLENWQRNLNEDIERLRDKGLQF